MVVGGVKEQAVLTSECNSNGYSFTAKISFSGVGATGGIPYGATASKIQFETPYDDTNPYDLEGNFTYAGFTASALLGYGYSMSGGLTTGVDLSYGDYRGSSSVSSFSSIKCGCDK